MALAQLVYVRPPPKRSALHSILELLGPFLDDQSNVKFACPLIGASAVRFTMDEGPGTTLTNDREGAMVRVEAVDISKKPLQRALIEYMI